MVDRGVAVIKSEFVLSDHVPTLALDCISTADKEHLDVSPAPIEVDSQPLKKFKRDKKDVLKGQNKNRGPTFRENRENQLCPRLVDSESSNASSVCDNERCTFMHDPIAYIAAKPKDIADECYVFNTYGFCPRGLTCRFGKSHITDDGKNIRKCDTVSRSSSNFLPKELQLALRKRTYSFEKSEKIVDSFDERKNKAPENASDEVSRDNYSNQRNEDEVVRNVMDEPSNCDADYSETKRMGFAVDHDVIKLRPAEKKIIQWDGKLILSPLTTVGNLPFRRICRELGADVTCGEMALASSLLQGRAEEWALVRRHQSEAIFGVQICGNNPYVMTKCAQLLQENIDVDFVDVNLGCPIDLVYKQGAGSGMLRRERMLINTLKSMSHVLDVPLTVKTRTGVYKDQRVAHTLVPRFVDCGVSLISIHGRTREQRYTKLADWDYIEECAKLANDVPVFGNGDVLSYIDYNENLEKCPHVKGVLLARGALYKPWLFTEIKEQRHWDISSSERMDIIRRYANYGLEHWGSDNKGVENTRRFLLEWLSFLHRYIPVGLLERPPQKINERPPFYCGRDELETLFASPNCKDWIKISEMLLGPVPDGFNFLPKHKANSWK